MAEREVFPFADDRALIARWLRGDGVIGQGVGALSTDWLAVANNQLSHVGTTVAWFDTAGALTVKLGKGAHYSSVVRVIHEICAQLGLKDVRVERQCNGLETPVESINRFTYYLDGVPVTLDQAHVLVGPMGMAAWRESVK